MTEARRPAALIAREAPVRTKPSNYPEPFASRMSGREKRALGDLFGLRNFGVNLTTLRPGAVSALHHRHVTQDEFVYVIAGRPTLFTDGETTQLEPGMCAGFPAAGVAHHLANETEEEVVYLEIGDRSPGDQASYPDDDLEARLTSDGRWAFFHKDGAPYDAP